MRRPFSRPDRYLTTVLFTDIVGSTQHATELGDRQWRERVEQHHELIRRELRRFGGREIDTAGDGFFAAFDAPARAVACALTVCELMPQLGLEVRAGVHTGEVEEVGGKLRGIGVHIGARVSASAGASEVLTSATVRDLVVGSGIDFEDRGLRELKGVPGEWHLYAATQGARFRDEFLAAAGTPGREVAAVRRTLERRAQRRRIAVMGGAVAFVAVVAAVGFLITRPPPSLAAVTPNSAGLIDAETGRIVAEVPIGTRPDAVAFGEGAIWVANTGDDTVSRIDPRSRLVVQTIDVGAAPTGVAVGYGSIWVANSGDRTVSRINPTTNRVVQPITVGNGPTAIATGAGAVWVTNATDGTLSRIDPTKGTVSVYPVGASPGGITVTDTTVWITDATVGTVIRVDAKSGDTVSSIGVGNGPTALTFASEAVWVANTQDGTVSRIDPATNRETAIIRVGDGPTALASSSGGIWVASAADGAMYRIDPATSAATRIPVGSSPQALVVANDELWFSARASAASHRGGTLHVVTSAPIDVIDPALAFDPRPWSVLTMTNDGLVAFQRTGGPAGTALVPDLAISIPRPADEGKTYTFQVRPGLVYSDGTPVRASDFRRALERIYTAAGKPESATGTGLYAGIQGASECAQHYLSCNLERGVVADDKTGTVTFHLTAPDPDFLQKLALPFAAAAAPSMPNGAVGTHPGPATGPYMISLFSPDEVRLVRNPRFRQWSRIARPDGYPNEIVISVGESGDKELNMIIDGSADALIGAPFFDQVDPDRLEQFRIQYPGQVHPWVSGTTNLYLNTLVPPFNDLRVRRAVNFALDRAKLVELAGGPLLADPTCQVLLPNTQGYRPYCPYTLNPNPGGTWTAPNVGKARDLVAASGMAGSTVKVGTFAAFEPMAKYLTSELNNLGFKAGLQPALPDFANPAESRGVQAVVVAWYPDFPSAGSQLMHYACEDDVNIAHFCDARFQAQFNSARQLQETDAAAAGDAWAALDRLVVDAAPIAALVNQRQSDFVSARVGNYQHHPQWGILFDQLWVQ